MKTCRKIVALLLLTVVMIGCDSAKGISGAYNMVNCKYSYRSLSNVSVSGMNLTNGFSVASVPRLMGILSGTATSIPLNMTVNLDVNNPNASEALLSGLQYIIVVDNMQLTSGSLNQSLRIASGETKTLPLNMEFDIAEYLKGDSKETMVNAVKNIAGVGGAKESNISVRLKPTFLIGSRSVTSPVHIPVNFTLGN